VDENKNQENINLILDKKDQLNKVIFEQGALINKNRQEELTLEKEQNLANTQRRLDSINTILTQETLSAKQIQSISQTRQSLELKLIDERLRILKQLDQENILTQEQQLELTNIQKERETQLSKIFIENQKLRSDVLDQELAKITKIIAKIAKNTPSQPHVPKKNRKCSKPGLNQSKSNDDEYALRLRKPVARYPCGRP